jgi:ribosomal protein L11 methyltransferase
LRLPARGLAEAQELSDRFDDDVRLAPLAVSLNEVDEHTSLWETVAYFEREAEAYEAHRIFAIGDAAVYPLEQRDWVRESLQGLQPVVAGRFYLHGSHDRARRRAGGISLEIDAGTAFGTGHHNTTTGCLLALDAILKQRLPRNVLDLGCGTGVLAIAAVRVAHRVTLATDIDVEAVRVTKANAALNGVGPLIRAVAAPGLKSRAIAACAPYDLILANILARPLAQLARGLSRLLAPGGRVVLSGLTADQLRWITACYCNNGLVLQRRLLLANWATLVLTKPQTTKRPVRLRAGRQVAETLGSGWEEA